MKEYYITYLSYEDGEVYIGCGHGNNGQDAVKDLMSYASVIEIIEVKEHGEGV